MKFLSISLASAMILLVLLVISAQVRSQPGSFSIDTPYDGIFVNGSVNISWNQANGSTSYTVLIDDVDPGTDISPQNNISQNWTIWNSLLVSDGLHYINITANNATGSRYATNNNISVYRCERFNNYIFGNFCFWVYIC